MQLGTSNCPMWNFMPSLFLESDFTDSVLKLQVNIGPWAKI